LTDVGRFQPVALGEISSGAPVVSVNTPMTCQPPRIHQPRPDFSQIPFLPNGISQLNRGGVQFYLIQRTDGLFPAQREGDDLLEFARKDLEYFRKLRAQV
jgi:hypothetical protein